MKVLVVGGGGREHALAWKLASSPAVEEVLVAPGNAGTAREPRCRNAAVAADDVDGLLRLAQTQAVELTVVGPETPLAAGLVDRFVAAGLTVFGPTRAAARLESSKAFCKDFLARHQIPTAAYRVFSQLEPALAYVADRGAPIVVKADGLAAGKGVVVATTVAEAQAAVRRMLTGEGARVVIEEFLEGEEASYIVIASGTDYLPLPSSQDHKRLGDGDTGPNTGGMGAYSPAPVVTAEVEARIRRQIIEPTLATMAAQGCPFSGFLYAGTMIAADGTPRVLEFNARLGDPEAQPLLMRMDSDLAELLSAAARGRLAHAAVRWKSGAALGVVMATAGYPVQPRLGDVIAGLEDVAGDDVKVFHAGTRLQGRQVVTAGGRALCVTALGEDVAAARTRAYAAVNSIRWPGVQYRHDIGHRALRRAQVTS